MRGHNGAATASDTLKYPPGIGADPLLPVTLADALAFSGECTNFLCPRYY
jgi:hypothetical protein